VAPQLGLLKSTLLQLDSTFSEREYGAGSFRDFMEKVAQTGAVTLKNAGRSMMVESREDGEVEIAAPQAEPTPVADLPRDDGGRVVADPADDEDALPQSPMTMQDGIRAVQHAFAQASPPPRWPMYVRQAKQFLKARIEGFDERKYGFASVVDVLRAAAKDGVLKLERDRHGAFRVFAGPKLTAPQPRVEVDEPLLDVVGEVVTEDVSTIAAEPIEEAPIVDVQPVEAPETPPTESEPESNASLKRTARKRKTPAPKPRAAKGARARKSTRTKSEAADR
jgi:hypothetical protein